MSGTTNPAFEDAELSMLEAGHGIDGAVKDKESRNEEQISCLASGFNTLENFLGKHRKACKAIFLIILNVLILTYFAFATVHWRTYDFQNGFNWCNGYGMLLLLIVFSYGGVIYYHIVKRYVSKPFVKCCQPLQHCARRLRRTKYGSIVGQTLVYACILVAIIVFLIFDTVDSRERLTSAIGIVCLVVLGSIFSKYPSRINWRPVLCGLILQFVFGLIIIRWSVGQAILECVSDKVATFLNFAKTGAAFIFSEELVEKDVFAFATLPVIYYFSFFIQILYYLGVMQCIILKLGSILQKLMDTTICESITCAANIFIGMTESPLLVKPYLNSLTSSELHTIMSSGFATVSGTVLLAYISFGAQPAHLITATLMAAPAALAYSKLFYPETEKSLTSVKNIVLEKSKDFSLMDAASKGAVAGIPLVLGIVANIIAFVSFIDLVNALLGWLGLLVGQEGITFEFILSRVFMPLSWVMGVPWNDCEYVATLIGLKTIVNEFVAYKKLGEFKKQGKIFGRSEAIATFAICGFANPGSIGITLGVLSSLAPERKEQISGAVVRAFVAGSAISFLTASTAGLLISENFGQIANSTTVALLNSTNHHFDIL